VAGVELTDLEWDLRARIYAYVVDHAEAPTYQQMASDLGIEAGQARQSFHRLHDAHALFLDPGTDDIRMLNPFSAIPTPFRVEVGERAYNANCAWDSLGIPGMLRRDAVIHARLEVAGGTVQIPVVDGMPRPGRDYLIHYSVPFRHWYDDLIHT
jgi:hypothetical protein